MIPKISDTRLKQLAKKIRPVVRGSNGTLHYIKPVNLKYALSAGWNLNEKRVFSPKGPLDLEEYELLP